MSPSMQKATAERHLAAIRLRHRPAKSDLPHDVCWTCQTYWPCDVGDLLDDLAQLRAACVRRGRNPGRHPQAAKGYQCRLCGAWWSDPALPDHEEDCVLVKVGQR